MPSMAEVTPPLPATTADPVQAGRDAMAHHRWQEAFEHLSKADLEGNLSGADLESLALAAFFAAHADVQVSIKERAFKAYEADGNELRAAYLAVDIARQYGFAGKRSIASGWVRRAERIIGSEGETYAHGYLALVRSEARSRDRGPGGRPRPGRARRRDRRTGRPMPT